MLSIHRNSSLKKSCGAKNTHEALTSIYRKAWVAIAPITRYYRLSSAQDPASLPLIRQLNHRGNSSAKLLSPKSDTVITILSTNFSFRRPPQLPKTSFSTHVDVHILQLVDGSAFVPVCLDSSAFSQAISVTWTAAKWKLILNVEDSACLTEQLWRACYTTVLWSGRSQSVVSKVVFSCRTC